MLSFPLIEPGLTSLIKSINEIVKDGGKQFYVKVVAKGAQQTSRLKEKGFMQIFEGAERAARLLLKPRSMPQMRAQSNPSPF
ncbi:hypothetical protein SAMN05720382_101533 [Polaromonas sp. JS666]|nr:hypothetical protein SAMN05720382_101533 [Polaromonas sp. JS666]